MNCPHHDALGDPSCRRCQEAHGWPIRLTGEEREEIAARLVRGEKVDLSGISHDDRVALRPFIRDSRGSVVDRSPRTPSEGSATHVADRMREIEARLVSLARSGFTDPRAFLRDAHPDALANVLSPEDFDFVMQRRAELQAARTPRPASPDPPKLSREAITAEVLRRYAEGQDAVQIAREMKAGRTLVQYIIDGK